MNDRHLLRAASMEHRAAGRRDRQVKTESPLNCIIAVHLKNTIGNELKMKFDL
jgi:hypothetical protein